MIARLGLVAILIAAFGGGAAAEDEADGPCYVDKPSTCLRAVAKRTRAAMGSSKDKDVRRKAVLALRERLWHACHEREDAEACVHLAIVMQTKLTGDTDAIDAEVALWRACEIDRTACWPLGRALQAGDVLTKNMALSKELRREAGKRAASTPTSHDEIELTERLDECDAGSAEACAKTGVLYDRGKGARRNRSLAKRYFRLACDLDRSTCMDIAQAYAIGHKVRKDRSLSKQFRKLALQREGEAGCRYGAADRCATYAHAYLKGTHMERDEEYATVLFSEACDAGSADGCAGLAERYLEAKGKGSRKKRRAAADLFDKACDAKSAAACWKLGRLHMRGEQVDQDTARAEALFKRACDLGDQAGCDYLAKKP